MQSDVQIQTSLVSDGDGTNQQEQQLQELFNRNYGSICELIEADDRLIAFDYNRLTDDIAGDVRRGYSGPDDDKAFLAWIAPAVQKRIQFYLTQRECEKSVLAGIWNVMHGAKDLSEYENPADTVRELVEDAWAWVWEHWEELLASPEAATWSTRLWRRGYWTGRAWKKSQLRHRERFLDLDDPDQIWEDADGEFHVAPVHEDA